MSIRNMNVRDEKVRRRSDGSIDTGYYIRRAHELRALAFGEALACANRWAVKQVRALMHSLKPRRLAKKNCLKDATLHIAAGAARINLSKGRLIRVQDGEGFRIRCYSGSLWITQERDGRDMILRAGNAFIIDRPGLTLVHALANAQVAVEDARRPIVVQDPKRARTEDWIVNYAQA
ncbi:MAG: DUF2917 domain-containing protein [Burkholderiales bacterium]